MSIQERQNLPASLDKLAAQRFLYRSAKLVRNWRLMLVLLVVGVMVLITVVAENAIVIGAVSGLAVGTWLVDRLVLERVECTRKTEAATIQEDFDCFVLDLPWPTVKGIRRPIADRVRHLASSGAGERRVSERLNNWYPPEGIPEDPIGSKIHCQRINCSWDVDLRRRWRIAVHVVLWAAIGAVVLISVVSGITVATLGAVAAASIRAMAWGLDETREQSAAVSRIERIQEYLGDVSSGKLGHCASEVRSIQDEIYEHRRLSPPVPDWFYWTRRDSQEADAKSAFGG